MLQRVEVRVGHDREPKRNLERTTVGAATGYIWEQITKSDYRRRQHSWGPNACEKQVTGVAIDQSVTTDVDQESRMTFELHNPVAIAHVATVHFQSDLRLRRLATKALNAVP